MLLSVWGSSFASLGQLSCSCIVLLDQEKAPSSTELKSMWNNFLVAVENLQKQVMSRGQFRISIMYFAQLGEHCTDIAEVVGSNRAQSLKIFSGLCSSSVTAALALMTVITQLLLWDKLLSSSLYLGQV